MTKKELINALSDFDEDSVVIIGDSESGWSNIEELKYDGSQIAIMPETDHPFNK